MKIADWIIAKANKTPYWHLEGYMERFWLIPYIGSGSERDIGCGPVSWLRRPIARIAQLFNISIRVHHILRSDDDRAFHDHPWPYLTIILKGGYWEIQPCFSSGIYQGDTKAWRGAGSILLRKANSWHRLEVEPNIDCWTLFSTGKYKQSWGFLVSPKAKVHYREFLGLDK